MAACSRERRYERRALNVDIILSDRTYPGELIFASSDISPAGVFLKSDLLLEVGERFDIQFALPGVGRKIRVEGRIVRADKGGGSGAEPGMGVEFVNLADEDREEIIKFTGGA